MWGKGAAFRTVLVGGRDGAMAEAIALAGGQVVAALSWGEPLVVERGAMLVLDTCGEEWTELPNQVLARVEQADVVCCDFAQLDAVEGALLLTDARLLCRPDMPDRVAALLVAARGEDAPTFVGETDGERLGRVSDELARVVDLLSHLVRQEGPGTIADRKLGYGAPPADVAATRIDPAEVRRVIRARRVRDKAFGSHLFEDPAWDILLDLFAASLERAEVSVSSLCIAAAVAPTTALRWIGRMTAAGLLVRERDPADRRRALMSLSESALAGMRSYLAMLRAQGLPFV